MLVSPVGPACRKPHGTIKGPYALGKPFKLASCAASGSDSSSSSKSGWLASGVAGLLGASAWLAFGVAGLLGASSAKGAWLAFGVAGLLGTGLPGKLGLGGGVPGSALKERGV